MTATESDLAHIGQTAIEPLREPPALLIGTLYERHYRTVKALCRLLLRDAAEAEDAAQQTFLSAYGSLIDGTEPRSPAAWLATIARRECWARTAQRQRRPMLLDDATGDAAQVGSALDEAIRNADLTALWKAINALPRQQRAAFLLREFSGLSYREVAEALGASESAIESLLVRARRELRDGLESAVKVGKFVLTPVQLLRDRLARLFDPGIAGGAAGKASLIPATVKIGAAVAGSAVVATGVGAGTRIFHSLSPSASASIRTAQSGGEALALLLGRTTVESAFPSWSSTLSAGSPVEPRPAAAKPSGSLVLLPGASTGGSQPAPGGDPTGQAPGPASDGTPPAADTGAPVDSEPAPAPTPSPDPPEPAGTPAPPDSPPPDEPASPGPPDPLAPATPDATPPDPTPPDTRPADSGPHGPTSTDPNSPDEPVQPLLSADETSPVSSPAR
jgi:RNA polymerase sigma-70 factor (ECF subfamily)